MSQTQTAPPTLREVIRQAFELSHNAKKLRGEIGNLLPRMTAGRDHGILHRAYCILSDVTISFDALEDRIAEMHALNRHNIK
jgi:hypothetical protein